MQAAWNPSTRPGRYQIESAVPDDDAALRALLRNTSMEGAMRLSLQREPDFFAAAELGNLATTVMVGRDGAHGHVVSTATRAIRRAFVDGSERRIGYLSSLRLAEEARKATLLARGYAYLRELDGDRQVPYYVTTILDGNEEARRVLTSGRAGLPVYASVGTLNTYLVPLYGRRKRSGRTAERATPEILPDVLGCLNRVNAGLQFAPAYRTEDFGSPMLRNLSPGDVYVYRCGHSITGTLAVWDQHDLKQPVVAGYSRGLRALRPLLALGAGLGLAPKLPDAGQTLPCLYAALMSSEEGDPAVFRELLETVLWERTNTGYAYLLIGVSTRHPFCTVIERHAAIKIVSGIYLVYWDDRKPETRPSSDRIPHLEVATL